MMVIEKEYKNKVCCLTINRPDKKNAMSKDVIEKLISFFRDSMNMCDFNVVLLQGSDNFFSAGADLTWMKQAMNQTEDENEADAQLFNTLYSVMDAYPKPIVVKVEGGAYGGAIGLLACADIVITTPESKFKFSETALGLIPATVAPYIIKRVGYANARYLLLTGTQFNGEDAIRYGLAHTLVSTSEIEERAMQEAFSISKLSSEAVISTKKLLQIIEQKNFKITEEIKNISASLIAQSRTSKESQARVSSFLKERNQNG